MNLPECDECRAILADYVAARRALAREMLASRLGTDEEFARAWHQARMLKTEADVLSAEELFPAVHLNSSSQVRLALSRLLAHEARTSHKLRQMLRSD